MSKSKSKALVETSAVRAKVGPTSPAHSKAFDEQTSSSVLYTSAYIRMEFIRRWICTAIEMASVISRYGNVSDALSYLEQSFSPRDVKAYIAVIAAVLESQGAISNSSASEEEFSRTAWHWLRRFDSLFPSRIQNRSHCKRGNKSFQGKSFATLTEDLAAFYKDFSTPITDCEVARFLALQNAYSNASKLLRVASSDEVKCLKSLEKYAQQGHPITCKECERIGDAVIALEQTKSYILLHVDKSFNHLCDVMGMPHKELLSLRASEKQE